MIMDTRACTPRQCTTRSAVYIHGEIGGKRIGVVEIEINIAERRGITRRIRNNQNHCRNDRQKSHVTPTEKAHILSCPHSLLLLTDGVQTPDELSEIKW